MSQVQILSSRLYKVVYFSSEGVELLRTKLLDFPFAIEQPNDQAFLADNFAFLNHWAFLDLVLVFDVRFFGTAIILNLF